MNCDVFEKNLDCFKTRKDVYGNTVTFNHSWSPAGTEFGQGNGFEINSETDDGDYPVIFACYDNGTLNLGNMTLINYHDQMEVAKFLRQDPKEWFKEAKYYLIVSKSASLGDDERIGIYAKDDYGYHIAYTIKENLLTDTACMFTQEEINDLKSRLPKNMADIVDLAKVEVKD